MGADDHGSGLELRSLVTSGGELQLSLEEVPLRELGPDEVLVRVEATPINPSDLALLLGSADCRGATGGTPKTAHPHGDYSAGDA